MGRDRSRVYRTVPKDGNLIGAKSLMRTFSRKTGEGIVAKDDFERMTMIIRKGLKIIAEERKSMADRAREEFQESFSYAVIGRLDFVITQCASTCRSGHVT